MVHAYLHLSEPVSEAFIHTLFLPEDEIDITPIFPDSFALASNCISPSRLRFRLEGHLPCAYVIADVKRMEFIPDPKQDV